jgi:hypothetical protein
MKNQKTSERILIMRKINEAQNEKSRKTYEQKKENLYGYLTHVKRQRKI